MMVGRRVFTYTIDELEPYVNWVYFYHAWQVGGHGRKDQDTLRQDALQLLREFASHYHTKAVFALCDAYSQGDDIIVGETRLPMLRQQTVPKGGTHCLCLADFVRPYGGGHTSDKVGLFATTVDVRMEKDYASDPYMAMMAQTLADRLAEATAERLHQQVRTSLWGYAAGERLSIPQMLRGEYVGIRPAVGYPSLPDTSLNFVLSGLLDMPGIGIRLTESGAMRPHASVSGLMLAHPQARYFNLGPVGEDQVAEYAGRRGLPVELVRRFLASNIMCRN